MSDYDNMILESKIDKHNTYLFIVFFVVCGGFFLGLIAVTSRMNRAQQSLKRVQLALEKQNKNVEKISKEFILKDEKTAEKYENSNAKYDDELLYTLLKKGENKNLYPMCLGVISCNLGQRYFKRELFSEWAVQVRKELNERQLLLEYKKGAFVFLNYHTTQNETDAFVELLLEKANYFLQFEVIKCTGKHVILEAYQENMANLVKQMEREVEIK